MSCTKATGMKTLLQINLESERGCSNLLRTLTCQRPSNCKDTRQLMFRYSLNSAYEIHLVENQEKGFDSW